MLNTTYSDYSDITMTSSVDYNITTSPMQYGITVADDMSDYKALYAIQLIVTVIGFSVNVMTLITLIAIGKQFTSAIRLLLMHQAWIDSWVCLQALILLVQPYMWNINVKWFDTLVCHLWHSQTVFWGSVDISVYGLVLIAFERYLATVHPLRHLGLRVKHLYAAIVAVNIFVMIFLMAPSYFQASIINGTCTTQYYFKSESFFKAMKIYPQIIFLLTYFTPCVLFIFFYGSILRLLHKRKNQHDLGSSEIVTKANAELLKTAMIVTIFFVISLSFDKWYYSLGHLGFFEYKLNTAIQKVGVFMTVLNSSINPWIYLIFMKGFRKRFYKWIRNQCKPSNSPLTSIASTSNSADRLNFRANVKHTPVPQYPV